MILNFVKLKITIKYKTGDFRIEEEIGDRVLPESSMLVFVISCNFNDFSSKKMRNA